MGLDIYTVDEGYVRSLQPLAPHLFHNSRPGQAHSRKFVGVVLEIGDLKYFAPLSSFKPKHRKMRNGMDFLKVGDFAVINLNCMFPVPDGLCQRVSIRGEPDTSYRSLLRNEWRIIRKMEDRIVRNARNLYRHKLANGNSTKLAARCNDFALLEEACRAYEAERGA